MGSEAVELVRRVYLAWEAGDMDELLSLVDPEVKWSPVLRFLEDDERAVVGRRDLHRWFRRGAHVLVLGRLVGASRMGGDLDVSVAWVWTVDAGRIMAMVAFRDERAARQAIASRRDRR